MISDLEILSLIENKIKDPNFKGDVKTLMDLYNEIYKLIFERIEETYHTNPDA